jgi:hypothetical protein
MLTEGWLVAAALLVGEPEPARRVDWYDTPASSPRRVSIAGQFEAQLIGLAFGPRFELMYRPFRPDRGANLVFGLGVQGGPDFFYMPFNLGWRQHFVPHDRLTLVLGGGFEQQTFVAPGLPAVSRPAFYGETGLAVRVTGRGWIGTQVMASWAPFERPGPGLSVRLGFRWDFE